MTVYVAFCSYNGGKLTHRLLDELDKGGHPYKLIMLEDQDTGRVGLPKARNWTFQRCLEQSDCTGICSISNDPYMLPNGWLDEMVQWLDNHEDYGAVTAGKMVNYGRLDRADNGWGNFDPIKGAYGQWYSENHPFWAGFECNYPQVGTLFVARKEAIVQTGLMDERFGMGGYEDIDYALRLFKTGFPVRFLGRIHYRYDIENPLEYDMPKSAAIFKSKWGAEDSWKILKAIRNGWETGI